MQNNDEIIDASCDTENVATGSIEEPTIIEEDMIKFKKYNIYGIYSDDLDDEENEDDEAEE